MREPVAASGTSSANPEKLVSASQAVPTDVRARLATAADELYDALSRLNAADQEPEIIRPPIDAHVEALHGAVADGEATDTFLRQVASGFYAVGHHIPLQGPGPHAGWWTVGNADLQAQLDAWAEPPPMQFRMDADGRYEVLGPDGQWYEMADPSSPGPGIVPPDMVPVGRTQQTIDLGGEEVWAVAAGATVMGTARPLGRPAPPWAYDQIHFEPDGTVAIGSAEVDPTLAPRDPMPGGGGSGPLPPRPHNYERGYLNPRQASSSAFVAQGALAGAGQFADSRHANVFGTQTTFYVDPSTGERVALVNAAHISYNDDGDTFIYYGQLGFDDDGRPDLVTACDSDVLMADVPREVRYAPPPRIVIPAEGGE